MLEFEPVKILKDKKAYMIVAEQIKHAIQSGSLQPGDQLPPERVLTEQFGVSRATMRQAFSVMEVMELIEVRNGVGAFICAPPREEELKIKVDWENSIDPWDIMEARMSIEPHIAALAAINATPKDIAEMRRVLDEEDKCQQTEHFDLFENLDNEFHFLIAKATHNDTLCMMAQYMFECRRNGLWRHMKFHTVGRRGLICDSHMVHESIFKAIEEHDAMAAQRRMISHFERLNKLVFDE